MRKEKSIHQPFFLLKMFSFSNVLYANYDGEIVFFFLMAILIEKKNLVGASYFYLQCSRQLQGRPLVVLSPHIHYLTLMLSLGLTSALSFENQIRPCCGQATVATCESLVSDWLA